MFFIVVLTFPLPPLLLFPPYSTEDRFLSTSPLSLVNSGIPHGPHYNSLHTAYMPQTQMSSPARPVRQSARQSAIRQQELEAEQEAMRQKALREEARREKAKQEAALREELARQEKLAQEEAERQRREQQRDNRSSSRSLSPALSGSSLSSDEGGLSEGEEEGEDDGDQANGDESAAAATDESNLRTNSTVALIYGFLTKFRPLLRQTCPLREVSIEVSSNKQACRINRFAQDMYVFILSLTKFPPVHTLIMSLSRTLSQD
jgi:hypothetical protein